ncbi:MAG: SDR family NAD(P)-dependent oxidoreductase, partial [Herpetosiphonaceae bacterium]|nr:SDR family NAD(P)-dependent oxidoreductase [Herpetosiphonaceae bacterium]
PEAMWALQPALFAFEYALAQMWMAWNVRPAAVLGHSMGEYVAACIAGVLSLEDGLKLVTYRAKCVERLPKDGAMLAVMASAEVVHGQLAPFNGAISVASYNSPSLVIVTGAKPALETLTDNLTRAEISYRTLPIANAFHSPAMLPIADEFAALAREIQHHPPQIPLVANLTGSIAAADQLGPDYWVQHLLEPVQFQRSIECLLQQQYRIFLEIGPRPTLANTIKRIVPADADGLILASLSSPYQPDWQMLMATLGQLFTRGFSLDWRAIDADYQRSIVALPPYPFERARYPIGRAERQPRALAHPRLHPLLDQEIVAPQIEGAVFQRRFEANDDRDLRDHRVRGAAILPGAAQIEMLLAAAAHSADQPPMGLGNITFTELLDIDACGLVQVVLSRNDHQQLAGQVMSRSTAGEWVRHAAGELMFDSGQPEIVDLAELRRRCPQDRAVDALYAHFAASGLVYGPAFRTVRHAWGGEREILAEIGAPDQAGYRLAPALLDGAFQALSLLFDAPGDDTFVPFAIDDIRLTDATPLPSRVFCHGRRTDSGPGPVRSADMTLLDETGRVLLRLRGLRLRQLVQLRPTVPSAQWLEIPCWRPSALPAPEPAQAPRTWLVFADSQGIADALIDQIRAAGDAVVKVEAGAAFEEMADGFVLGPARADDYTALATALAERRIDGLLHLWSCALPPGWPATAAEIDQQLDLGAKSLLCVLRALGSQGGLPAHVGVATRYAQAIDDAQERPVAPIQAALWGLSRVVALEYPATRVVAVDLDAAPLEQNAARMWAEMQAAHRASGSWAIYHEGQRLVAALAPAPVAGPTALRPNGVYLISGGQGGIGLEIARWIARQGAATVVLLNRSPLDSNAHPKRAQGIRDVAALGTVVETVAGDVADATEIAALVAAIVDRHGRLDGIFHAAGVLDDALLWNMDPARFDRVLRPKVHGTWALGQAVAQLDLAQFVICSSMASFEPSPGQANHAAANAVQDSLAHSLRRTGQPALSINWGLWGETGVVATEHYLSLLRARGIYPFTIAEGLGGLEAALGSGAAQAAFAKKLPGPGLEARAAQLAAEHGLDALAGASAPLTQLCGAYVANALVVMGLHPLLHSSFTQAGLVEQLRIAPQHRQVFARLLTLLQRLGKLQKTATGYELRDLTFQLDLDAAATALAEQYPGLASEIGLVCRCGSELGAVLTGDCDPLSLLFPKGSLEPSGQMYAQSPFARAYNGLAAEVIVGLQRPGHRLRILEVGAGTGGTTTPILDRLAADATDYTFSDISQRFLRDAQRKYAAHPGMRYAILDLEADLIAQGQHAASYDVIVAANVIHATSDIGQVVARLGQLLAPGGRMVIVELTQPQDWLDLTFGLTEGWWKFTDTAIRADYPLLDSPGWQAVLTMAGFTDVNIVAPVLLEGSAPVVQAVITATGWRSVAVQPAVPETGARPTPQPISGAPLAANTAQRWLQDRLTARIIEALKLPGQTLPPASSFHDIGLDSLLAVEIAAGLRRDLGIDIGPTLFFEYPSVRELAAYLWQIQGDGLAALAAAASPTPPTVLATPQDLIRAPAPVEAQSQDIAIIGMACRFPGAADSAAFWELLCRGADTVGDVPGARWDWRAYFDPTPGATGKTYSRWGGYIEDVDCFDARFFNISPKEAALMDPQQRLFLQTAWHTLEHAGYAGAGIATTGVFVGCSYNHYLQILNRHNPELAINHFAALGNNHALLANRVSYFLNLTGPSMSIDTLCSSALTALHMACSSLHNGEADMMLVGGVNLLLSADHYLSMSQMRAYSADGRCKAFDQRADGFVSGEGVGAVLIKPLAQALADGDTVHAIIKGSAVTHNGRTSGLTIPQARNQAAAIRRAHAAAGWDPASVGYIEAHGTGTALGDPIEIDGLAAIFGPRQPDEPPCYLGSVKTNIGHLEAAAGIAGLIKTILSLKHGSIPASLHFETANPHINFAATPFVVNTRLQPWPANQPRRAGISAFGLGGVNAHVALEEAPVETAPAETAAIWMLPLSAASPAALNALVDRYYQYMLTAATQRLEDICYTAAVGRGSFRQRLAILATSGSDLLEKLRLLRDRGAHEGLQQQGIFYGTARLEHNDGLTAAFVFQGQDRTAELIACAQAYTGGLPIDWKSLYATTRVRRIAVPLYPFERQRHWFEARVTQPTPNLDLEEIEPALHPLLGIRLP